MFKEFLAECITPLNLEEPISLTTAMFFDVLIVALGVKVVGSEFATEYIQMEGLGVLTEALVTNLEYRAMK